MLCARGVNAGGQTECLSRFTCISPDVQTDGSVREKCSTGESRIRSTLEVFFQPRCGKHFLTILPCIYTHRVLERASGAILSDEDFRLCNIRGNYACFRAKPVHLSGHLPVDFEETGSALVCRPQSFHSSDVLDARDFSFDPVSVDEREGIRLTRRIMQKSPA